MTTSHSPMTEAELPASVVESLKAWNEHDIDAILAGLTDDVVLSQPGGGPIRGKAAVAADLKMTFTAFPDFHLIPEESHLFLSVDKQSFVSTWTWTATMTGPLTGPLGSVPATGKPVVLSGAAVCQIRDGLVSQYTQYWDDLSFMQQLGLLPKTDGFGFKALVAARLLAGKATKARSTVKSRINAFFTSVPA